MQKMRLDRDQFAFDSVGNRVDVYRIGKALCRIIAETEELLIYVVTNGKGVKYTRPFYGHIRFRSKYRIEFEAITKEEGKQFVEVRA